MKKLVLAFCLTICCQILFAQKISVTVRGGQDSVVRISYPVDGFHYMYLENGKSEKYDASAALIFENTLKSPDFLYLVNGGRPVKVFAEPGKNLEIDISYLDKVRVVKVNGANAEGIERLNASQKPFYQTLANEYSKKDSVLASINEAISRDLKHEVATYYSLFKLKKVNTDFYKAVENEIRCYYAAVNAAVVFLEYNRAFLNEKHPLYKKNFPADFEAGWADVYKQFPMDDLSAAHAEDFYFYAKDYLAWYRLFYAGKKAGTFEVPANDDEQLRRYFDGLSEVHKGKIKEFLLARLIFDEASEMRYQKELVVLYNGFTKMYPDSRFTVFLTPLIDKINAYYDKARMAFKNDQKILENRNIFSFKDLMGLFKGKKVFVDVWATWCGPCKEQFQFNPGLKKYLKANGVEMLYISMDNLKADKQWREMIKYYDLSGTHIRAADALKKDLMNLFWDGKSYSIPRYLIVKDGVVVEESALRPGDGQKLYDQIGQ
jgi:thiol-disulfide isomerase/thioredoxin